MCSGGGGSSSTPATDYPIQPYRTDPDVQKYYTGPAVSAPRPIPFSGRGNDGYDADGYLWNPSTHKYEKIVDPTAPVGAGAYVLTKQDLTNDSEKYYNAWEEAYYKYQKDKTKAQNDAQTKQQEDYMNLQKSMGEQQLSLQKDIQQQQIAAQDKLTAVQQQMNTQQLTQQKLLEDQRLKFEKDAAITAADSKREIAVATKKAQTQSIFQAGRADVNRKNAGSVMATRGTKALQVGINSSASSSSGLAIPA